MLKTNSQSETNRPQYGVIGDPILHSKSPSIHQQFAAQFERSIDYQKYHVKPDSLESFTRQFFAEKGLGLNVTLPHKQAVIPLLDSMTDRAKITQSVNTIIKQSDGSLLGDTTDGAGLLLDLKNQDMSVANKQIIVIGAGGASLSIIQALLEAQAKVILHNRTQSKVLKLVKQFSSIGDIVPFDSVNLNDHLIVDGIISSISEFNAKLFEPLKPLINDTTFGYDLNYAERANEFRVFCEQNGIQKFADGSGMLIGQAALAYQHWFDVLPDIKSVNLA